MAEDKTVGTLNHLIAICRDGEEFYSGAAETVTDPNLQSLFREMARIRQEITEDLRPEVAKAGGSPAEGGTLAGSVRRVFANIKASLSSDKHEVLLAELVEAEERALAAFEQAQHEPVSPESRSLIEGKLRILRGTHDRMKQVKSQVTGG